MKVVLIAVPIMDYRNGRLHTIAQDESRECPPYGIYLLSSVLERGGHEVILIDLIAAGSRSLRPYLDDIASCSLVGISATSLSWPTAVDVIRQVRSVRDDLPIVLGGIHATMFDRYLLRAFPVQFAVRGEGEIALLRLCNTLEQKTDLSQVPNLTWVTTDGKIARNPLGPQIHKHDLGGFPLPNYNRLASGRYKGLAIESSRGCAFDCSFCSTAYRLSWRGIPAEQFVDRLEVVLEHICKTRYGTTHIIDDEFSMNPKRAIEITHHIRKRSLKPHLVFDSRANDLLFDGYVENIAEYTHQFLVGAECGYDEGLKLIGKGTTCDRLEKAAAILYENGISRRADFSFILGLPWETHAEVEKTIRFAIHLFSTYDVRILLQWYAQIPGSRLWEEDRKRGLVNETMYNEYGFFRNLHLFLSGVKLSPRDVWEIEERIGQIQWMASLVATNPRIRPIENAFPEPIAQYFPRETVFEDIDDLDGTGLPSLRQVSRPPRESSDKFSGQTQISQPPVKVGIPRRHYE